MLKVRGLGSLSVTRIRGVANDAVEGPPPAATRRSVAGSGARPVLPTLRTRFVVQSMHGVEPSQHSRRHRGRHEPHLWTSVILWTTTGGQVAGRGSAALGRRGHPPGSYVKPMAGPVAACRSATDRAPAWYLGRGLLRRGRRLLRLPRDGRLPSRRGCRVRAGRDTGRDSAGREMGVTTYRQSVVPFQPGGVG